MPPKASAKTKKPVKPPKASLAQGGKEVKPKKETVLEAKPLEVDEKETVEAVEMPLENGEKGSKKEKYFQSVGRRKESVATVRLFTKKSTDNIEGDHALITVNNKDYRGYFSDKLLQSIVESPLRKLKSANRFKATVRVSGGGLSGQADAIKHGLSRTLVMFDQNFRKKLKKSGFLTRDSRIKERRKYGLKKARKAPQWQKR